MSFQPSLPSTCDTHKDDPSKCSDLCSVGPAGTMGTGGGSNGASGHVVNIKEGRGSPGSDGGWEQSYHLLGPDADRVDVVYGLAFSADSPAPWALIEKYAATDSVAQPLLEMTSFETVYAEYLARHNVTSSMTNVRKCLTEVWNGIFQQRHENLPVWAQEPHRAAIEQMLAIKGPDE